MNLFKSSPRGASGGPRDFVSEANDVALRSIAEATLLQRWMQATQALAEELRLDLQRSEADDLTKHFKAAVLTLQRDRRYIRREQLRAELEQLDAELS